MNTKLSRFRSALLGACLLGLLSSGCSGPDYEELSRRECELMIQCDNFQGDAAECAEKTVAQTECMNESLDGDCIEAADEQWACNNGLTCEQRAADPAEQSHPCHDVHVKAEAACRGVNWDLLVATCPSPYR